MKPPTINRNLRECPKCGTFFGYQGMHQHLKVCKGEKK